MPKREWSLLHPNDPWKLRGSGRTKTVFGWRMRKNFAEVLVYRCNLVKVWEWHPLETIFEQAQKLRKQFSVLVFHVVFLTDLYRKKNWRQKMQFLRVLKMTSLPSLPHRFDKNAPNCSKLHILVWLCLGIKPWSKKVIYTLWRQFLELSVYV